ncbi:MAG: immunoglobulin domain-containing protein [Tahibacter sp.]
MRILHAQKALGIVIPFVLYAAGVHAQGSPMITVNPANQTVAAGSVVSFVAAATGNPTPSVRWQQSINGGANFTTIPGATSPTLSFTASMAQNGYVYWAIFTNSVGSTASNVVLLTTTPLGIAVDDGYALARYGSDIDYVVRIDNFGTGVLGNVNVGSAASPALSTTGARYTCVLAIGGTVCPPNGNGALAASVATLPAGSSLSWIVHLPVAATTAQDTVTLSVSATGGVSASDSDIDTLVLFRDAFESTRDTAGLDGLRGERDDARD